MTPPGSSVMRMVAEAVDVQMQKAPTRGARSFSIASPSVGVDWKGVEGISDCGPQPLQPRHDQINRKRGFLLAQRSHSQNSSFSGSVILWNSKVVRPYAQDDDVILAMCFVGGDVGARPKLQGEPDLDLLISNGSHRVQVDRPHDALDVHQKTPWLSSTQSTLVRLGKRSCSSASTRSLLSFRQKPVMERKRLIISIF